MKRLICGALAITVMCGMCACSDKKETANIGKATKLTYKISDEPIELTYFAKNLDNPDGDVFKEAFNYTNVMVKPTLSENVTDTNEALALAIAAKNIPDIVYDYLPENFNKYGMQKALIPLNDLIDKYAPNYKKFLEEHPDVKYFSTASDGNMYFIPYYADGEASTAWFIRQDWLDKLGLQQPNNLSEFHDVCVAFKTKDPNGNGKADETPFFSAKADTGCMLSLFNAGKSFKYADGKAIFSPMTDEFKTAVIEIEKWYSEGLIDEEWFTREDAMDHFLTTNTGGITHGWIGSTSGRNDSLKESVPGINFIPFAPPEGPDGVRREQNRRSLLNGEGWAISSLNKHPEETMKYFDFWFTEEGRRLANFGIEGVQYDMKEGKPQFRDSVLHGDTAVSVTMLNMRAKTNFGYWQDFEYEKQWLNDIAKKGMELYTNGGFLPQQENRPILRYLDDEDKHIKLKTQIETYVDENVQKWIFGNEDINGTFDSFKKNLTDLGIEEYVKIEQKAYDEYLKQVK